jgi:hypothetical protein
VAGARGAKPLGPNSNFTPGAFAHCYTFLNIVAFAHVGGLRQGRLSQFTQTQNFTPGLCPFLGPTEPHFGWTKPRGPKLILLRGLLPIFRAIPYPIIAPKLKILLRGLLPIFWAHCTIFLILGPGALPIDGLWLGRYILKWFLYMSRSSLVHSINNVSDAPNMLYLIIHSFTHHRHFFLLFFSNMYWHSFIK